MKNILKQIAEQGKIKKEKGIGFDQIVKRLDRALIDIKNAKLIIKNDEIGAYRIAYDAMLQTGLALILYHGYRPQVKNFHKTVVECSRLILGKKYYFLVKQFDQMRKNRHNLIYDISFVSREESISSIKAAEKFIKEIVDYIKKDNPQKAFNI
ncbi:MAG: hypothetical protein U9R06_02050 [Patescibacteria group bacterium]|nr:hypothetical protein [Patescibacteria group bacterium]